MTMRARSSGVGSALSILPANLLVLCAQDGPHVIPQELPFDATGAPSLGARLRMSTPTLLPAS